MSHIRTYAGYIFDLDGTIYLGDALLPAAAETLAALRERGRRLAFLSNNPTRTRAQYAEKLQRLGIPATVKEVVNSSAVMVEWLREHAPDSTIYVLGEPPLINELQAAGFRISEDPSEIRFVVASFDRTLVYHKLQVGFDALRAGARLIATNADRYCPVPGGGEPDAAAVIAALEACSSRQCELVVGKPSPIMARTVSTMIGLPPEQCLMVGDRLETDIAMGVQAGMDTALVLTGASRRSDLGPGMPTPTYVWDDLRDLAL